MTDRENSKSTKLNKLKDKLIKLKIPIIIKFENKLINKQKRFVSLLNKTK